MQVGSLICLDELVACRVVVLVACSSFHLICCIYICTGVYICMYALFFFSFCQTYKMSHRQLDVCVLNSQLRVVQCQYMHICSNCQGNGYKDMCDNCVLGGVENIYFLLIKIYLYCFCCRIYLLNVYVYLWNWFSQTSSQKLITFRQN